MIIQISDDFDLKKIAQSGQCFRWEAASSDMSDDLPGDGSAGEKTYRIIADDRCLYITASGEERFDLDCTKEEYEEFWKDYFDLEENYQSIREKVSPEEDPFLFEASEHEKGIRILRQDPWEMLISFIISQNKNIPAIRRSVEMLAHCCGDRRVDSRGQEYYAFPDAKAVARLTQEELCACRLGYRWKYVQAAGRAVAGGEIDLNALWDAEEAETISQLTGLFGVGVKVANCVSLFGLHHIDAFPIDVWIKRILAEQYPEGYPYERYTPYNGIFQQYMFAYYRNR